MNYYSEIYTDSCGRKRRYYHVPCPTCGNIRKLQASDMRKGQSCKGCQLIQATINSRRNNPSSIELVTRKRLQDAGLDFRSEVEIRAENRRLAVDFMIEYAGRQIAIECCDENDYYHSLPEQKERDALKRKALAARRIPVIDITPVLLDEVVNLVRMAATLKIN